METKQELKKIVPNLKQQKCIETINGPVMVLAGPGTGKTFTVIHRVKYMLDSGINPSSILCLTYSSAAANEMKGRLVSEIGARASAITVNTYHAFCNEIIKNNPEEFELLNGVSLIDEITKRTLMKEAVDIVNPQFYRTKWGDAYYFIPELIDVVKEIKSSQITKEEYFNTLNTHPDWQGQLDLLNIEYIEREQKGRLVPTFINKIESLKRKIGKAKEAWDIYEAYDINLKKNNFIDFDDMISLVLEAFTNNTEFLKRVSSQYKYFLVDEYQDTNYSENSIVFKLAEGADCCNIFVVGDDDQIIYEFQGAKTDTLQKFLIKFPQTKVICLNENNRSTQNILDFSYKLISQDETRLEFNKDFSKYNISKRLTAKNPKIIPLNKKVQIHSFSDIKQENNFIISDIKRQINSDDFPINDNREKDLSKIAILTRDNNELTNFAKLLEAENIQYQVKVSKSIFDIRSSILIYFYLQTMENYALYADKMFALLLSKPFDFNPKDYNFLLEQNRYNHKDLITNIYENIETHSWQDKEKVKKFIDTFNYLKDLKSSENIKNLIIETVNKTGILEYFINCDVNKTDNIYAIKKIIDEAQGLTDRNPTVSLSDFINHIETSFSSNIPILIDKEDYTQNAVQLLTIHGSKGREFDYVYVPNLISKKWENRSNTSKKRLPIEPDGGKTDIDKARRSEQLRLLFVALTRAKHYLMLSFSNIIDGAPQEMTSYISNITDDENLIEMYKHEFSNEEYLKELYASVKRADFDYNSLYLGELKAIIKDFSLSPSSLNTYLNCPRQFLYSNLLKIPVYESASDAASYGSAFHKALELTVRQAKQTGRYPDKNQVIENFKKGLNLQKFATAQKRSELEERGIKSFNLLYPKFIEIPVSRIYATEFNLDHVPFGNHFLKGYVDRIEINSDGTYEMYDYKTNSAKSKSSISDGGENEDYLNQLRFYKYTFEKLNPNCKVTRAGLLFVEDFTKNFYINLTEEDNQIIEEKISYAYKSIDNLNFNPPEKSEKTCQYCAYKEFCTLNLY